MRFTLSFIMLLLFGSFLASAQALSDLNLTDAYRLLEARYPTLKDGTILEALYQKDQELIERNRMPSLYLKGEGRFQSQSTSLESDNEMMPIEINQPLGSLRSYVEANYLLLDGGRSEVQADLLNTQLAVDQQGLEVQRYHLRQQINRLFLQVKLLEARRSLLETAQKDLATQKDFLQAGVDQGVLLESEVLKLAVRGLEIDQQISALDGDRKGALQNLERLLGIQFSEEVHLALPRLPNAQVLPVIDRPELDYFKLQENQILAQNQLLEVARKPTLGVFAQAGVGYPNPLNILDNGIAPYGLVGATLSWRLTDWNKTDLEKEKLILQSRRLQHAAEELTFNLEAREASYLTSWQNLNQQIQKEREIAALQKTLLAQLAIQLEEGVITSTDYLLQFNAELKAKQQIVLYEIEQQRLQLDLWFERGAAIPSN